MELVSLKDFRIIRPLKYQFTTSFSTREYISHIIIEATWLDGNRKIVSYGESTTHSEPFYNGEFDQTAFCYYNRVFPYLLNQRFFDSPEDLHKVIDARKFNKQHRFAIAALDICFHDAFSKKENISLSTFLLNHYNYPSINSISKVPVGISRGMKSTPEELAESIKEFLLAGNKKIKLKISPEKDLAYIDAVRNVITSKDIVLSADANASYDEMNSDHISRVFNISHKVDLLEQPFSYDDIWGHAMLVSLLVKDKLSTKICLDESIRHLKDLQNFISQISTLIGAPLAVFSENIAVNIKISRVGGLTEAMKIAKYCLDNNIQIMPGGMHEFDFGQSAIVSFNAINSDFYPGDSEGSETYYAGALTFDRGARFEGLKTNRDGSLNVPIGIGLGVGELAWGELQQIGSKSYISTVDISSGNWAPKWNSILLDTLKSDIGKQMF